ncbi:MAG: hypothetical protein J6U00_07820 [Ruminococcus sp.]|uniref:hypothetical protein n=1 Tax=Ruminococcus sp. TaxID=41978 RepID=UPI001B05659B|nr:hypothetical protein [Ruminococcus sp.]MBO7473899.1 hypothetical protein [Ruminococcus sp.]
MSDINNIINDENEQQIAQNGRPPMPPQCGHGQQFSGQPSFDDQQTDNASDNTEV